MAVEKLKLNQNEHMECTETYGTRRHVTAQHFQAYFPEFGSIQPCDDQDVADFPISLFKFFLEGEQWHPQQHERVALLSAYEAAFETKFPKFKGNPHITWFGKYGCALMATQSMVSCIQLNLIGLDEWSFRVHSGPRTRTYDSAACTSKHIPVGDIAAQNYARFLDIAAILLGKATSRKGNARSAGSNEQVAFHQKHCLH